MTGLGVKVEYDELLVLDLDSECRPMAWYGGDFVTRQPTAIAWKFVDEPDRAPDVVTLGNSNNPDNLRDEEIEMLQKFIAAYNMADMVTGHFIRGFDLPLLNGACMRLGIPGLGSKLSQDTKLDAARRNGLSMSQENLGAMWELDHPKHPMNTALWFEANCLTTRGRELTRVRVVSDVEQHIDLRAKMLELGLLAPPRPWTPESTGHGGYLA